MVKIKTDNRDSRFFPKPKPSAFRVAGTYSRNIWMNDLDVQASWQGHLSVLMASVHLAGPAGWAGFLVFPQNSFLRYSKAFLLLKEALPELSQDVPGCFFPCFFLPIYLHWRYFLICTEALPSQPPNLPESGEVFLSQFPPLSVLPSSMPEWLVFAVSASGPIFLIAGFCFVFVFVRFVLFCFCGASSLIKQGNGP